MSQKKSERPILEAILENGEAAVDLVITNEAIKAVPVIGTIFKLIKGAEDIQSRLLHAKLIKLLSEPSLCSAAEARKLSDKLLDDEEQAREVGETLFMVLDNVTDMKKPTLLAKVFAAYLDGVIGRDIVLMLAHTIDRSFLRDLEQFIESPHEADDGYLLWRERLVSTGLMTITQRHAFDDDISATNFKISPLGEYFLEVMKHCDARR